MSISLFLYRESGHSRKQSGRSRTLLLIWKKTKTVIILNIPITISIWCSFLLIVPSGIPFPRDAGFWDGRRRRKDKLWVANEFQRIGGSFSLIEIIIVLTQFVWLASSSSFSSTSCAIHNLIAITPRESIPILNVSTDWVNTNYTFL